MNHPQTEVIVSRDGTEMLRKIITPGEYCIGSEPGCDLQLEIEEIASKHALLRIHEDHVLIEDLGNGNGTRINDRLITSPTRIWPNQKIKVGLATIELRRLKSESSSGPLAAHAAVVRKMLPEEVLHEKKYVIGGIFAQGGMGMILDAKDRSTGRTVAMKVMRNRGSADAVIRFISEAKITAHLEHPNIVPVHELSVYEDDQVFYTMKFVRGETLHAILDKLLSGDKSTIEKYPLAALLTVFQKICDALSFAHSKGVIHRDLKPDNVMIGDYGEVLVMDWGLAKAEGENWVANNPQELDGSSFETLAGQVMGSPHYMSPEQARGEIANLDARTDIYALGAILYHLITLSPPVQGQNAADVLSKVSKGELAPAFESLTDSKMRRPHLPGARVPESLIAVTRKAMAFTREDRYGKVAELQSDISAYQNGFATHAENAGTAKQFALLLNRHKGASVSIGGALLLLISVSTAFTLRILQEKNTAVSASILANRERNRAEHALADLKMTAPTFFALSKALVEEGKFSEAIEKAHYAIQLDERNSEYHLLRANLLQATQQLAEAMQEYRNVLALRPQDSMARTNLTLCEDMRSKNGGAKSLNKELQKQLLNALCEQNRLIEAGPLSALLEPNGAVAEATLRARMREYRKQQGWNDNRVQRNPDGTFKITLDNLALGDLAFLKGMAIADLSLNYTEVADLGSLVGLPIKRLSLNYSKVNDLSPLRRMPLESLELVGVPATDLSPLTELPLRHLKLDRMQITQLPPLNGMAIESLSVSNTRISDLSPLVGMPLVSLNISATHVTNLTPLAGLPLVNLDISFNQIADLAPLAECHKLQRLLLSNNRVFDLTPLTKLSLTEIDCSNTNVASIAPLRGQPLRRAKIDRTYVTDLSPLQTGGSLEEIVIPSTARNVEVLRKLPLKSISTGMSSDRPAAQTVPEFWKEFDRSQSAGTP